MFKNLGKIEYKRRLMIKLDPLDIKIGLNLTDELIILKIKKYLFMTEFVIIWKTNLKNNKTFCPMHNWEFIPEKGKYTNGLVKKKKFEFEKNKILSVMYY